MRQEATTPTTCDRCGKAYNTSRQHPRRYCSIACEEGRSALPIDDPSSEGYHLHIQQDPNALVGKTLLARGMKRTCYSPDWHRDPSDYRAQDIVAHDEENEVIIYKTTVRLGKVTHLFEGRFCLTMDEGEQLTQYVDPSVVVKKLRKDEWWAE
jgi:hypothetical protein